MLLLGAAGVAAFFLWKSKSVQAGGYASDNFTPVGSVVTLPMPEVNKGAFSGFGTGAAGDFTVTGFKGFEDMGVNYSIKDSGVANIKSNITGQSYKAIVEGKQITVRPYQVVSTGDTGKSLKGGGVSSGMAISARQGYVTPMSSGFAKLAKKYGVV